VPAAQRERRRAGEEREREVEREVRKVVEQYERAGKPRADVSESQERREPDEAARNGAGAGL